MATVLVVDDLPSELQLMVNTLQGAGYSCITATNGEEAVQKATTQRPAVILLDVVMPRQDGFATCRTLKKNPQTSGIPVILVTSKNQESDQFWGKKQGAAEYITKPFVPSALVAAVRRFA